MLPLHPRRRKPTDYTPAGPDDAPPAEHVTDDDQYWFLGSKTTEFPDMVTCRCDVVPYMHLTCGVVDEPTLALHFVFQRAAERLTILAISNTEGATP